MDIRGNLFYRLHKAAHALHGIASTLSMRTMAWAKGVKLGSGCTAVGHPYFYRVPNTSITLGRECKLLSSFRSNNVGSMSRCRIATITPWASIVIGDRVGMSATTIAAHQSVTIGDDTMVGAGTVITDSDWHSLSTDVRERHTADGKTAPVTIGRNVFIGTRCLILKGVTIGDNAVIGAGSVVTQNIPANAIAAGNPCRVLSHK